MTTTLNLLCAGAAQGLVKSLEADFCARHGVALQARFGAVGAMKEALIGGSPCDLMVLTDTMVAELAADGRLDAASRAPLGRVRTGVAVAAGRPVPEVSTPEGLKAALLSADAIYFPDPVRATAGIHFARVMRELGVHDALAPRFRNFPNGATAMRELALAAAPGHIGCTQVSEILYTPGVVLAGVLPPQFELATLYSAAVARQAAQPVLATLFIASLAGPEAGALRAAGGFGS